MPFINNTTPAAPLPDAESGRQRVWLTVQQTSVIVGRSPNWINDKLLPLLDANHKRKVRIGGRGRAVTVLHIASAVQAMIAAAVQEAAPVDDPMMQGGTGDSPALERYREAKATMLELDLAERRGELVNRPAFREWVTRVTLHIRHAGETLQRRLGVEAQQILDDALDEAGREIKLGVGAGPDGKMYHIVTGGGGADVLVPVCRGALPGKPQEEQAGA